MSADDPTLASIRDALIGWERMRLKYNAVLAIAVLGGMLILLPLADVVSVGLWVKVGILAVIANLFFTIGPLLEVYVQVLGANIAHQRKALALAGTLFSLFLALLFVLSRAMDAWGPID